MRIIILICFFLIAFVLKSNAQEKHLELIKISTSRILKIEEDKRVVIKTKDEKRFVGKIKFIDSLHIEVGNNVIHLDSLSFIKKRTIEVNIIKKFCWSRTHYYIYINILEKNKLSYLNIYIYNNVV